MKDITHNTPTVKKVVTVHRIAKSLMPQEVKDQLIDAAIMLSIQIENLDFVLPEDADPELVDIFDSFADAAYKASNYTEPVEMEVDEPVRQ